MPLRPIKLASSTLTPVTCGEAVFVGTMAPSGCWKGGLGFGAERFGAQDLGVCRQAEDPQHGFGLRLRLRCPGDGEISPVLLHRHDLGSAYEKKPTARWSCSVRLFKYWIVRCLTFLPRIHPTQDPRIALR